jgi:hypothetical protein
MKRCVHCWHDFEPGVGSEQVDARGAAWSKSMTRIAEDIFIDPEARDLLLFFCCKSGEPRVDRAQPLLRAYG